MLSIASIKAANLRRCGLMLQNIACWAGSYGLFTCSALYAFLISPRRTTRLVLLSCPMLQTCAEPHPFRELCPPKDYNCHRIGTEHLWRRLEQRYRFFGSRDAAVPSSYQNPQTSLCRVPTTITSYTWWITLHKWQTSLRARRLLSHH